MATPRDHFQLTNFTRTQPCGRPLCCAAQAVIGIDANSNLFRRAFHGELSMRRSAAVGFLVALFPSHGQAAPGTQSYIADLPSHGFIAVAEVGSPPPDIGATLWAWDHIKSSNNVSELEALVTRYKGSFLAELARRRIEALESQRLVHPSTTSAAPN
jgi:hypothetical protein